MAFIKNILPNVNINAYKKININSEEGKRILKMIG
jgi:hypothetical protein